MDCNTPSLYSLSHCLLVCDSQIAISKLKIKFSCSPRDSGFFWISMNKKLDKILWAKHCWNAIFQFSFILWTYCIVKHIEQLNSLLNNLTKRRLSFLLKHHSRSCFRKANSVYFKLLNIISSCIISELAIIQSQVWLSFCTVSQQCASLCVFALAPLPSIHFSHVTDWRGWEGMAGIITSQNTRRPLSSATATQDYRNAVYKQVDLWSCVPHCRHREGRKEAGKR